MNEESISARIERLVAEEHELRRREEEDRSLGDLLAVGRSGCGRWRGTGPRVGAATSAPRVPRGRGRIVTVHRPKPIEALLG